MSHSIPEKCHDSPRKNAGRDERVFGSDRGRWPGHEITKNRCAPFIHSFIVDEWETTNLMFLSNGNYDTLGRMNGGGVCFGGTYFYCAGGQQKYVFTAGWKGAQLQSSNDTALGQNSTYTYDGFNRLLAHTANSVQDYSWVYDRYGNRRQQSYTGTGSGSTFSQSFNTATRY